MGHSRIKMELIKKESTRMLTYQKRKKSLVKKVSEFSILCGVEACLIVFGPKHKDQPVKKLDTIWPSNSDEAKRIINKYKKTDQARRCYHVSDYFSDKKKKLDVEISKLRKQVYNANYPSWEDRLENLSEDQLRVLLARLESKLQVADQKFHSFQENQNNQMDMFAPRMVNNSNNMESYMPRSNNFQVFSDLMKPLDAQYPICFIPGHNPYMFPSNSNFMESNNINNVSLQLLSDSHSTLAGRNLMDMNNNNNNSNINSNNLQLDLFSPKPLDVQFPIYNFPRKQSFPGMPLSQNLMEEKMSNNQNFSNQFGGGGIFKIPSLSGLSYVNPQFLMPNNVMHNNLDASMPLQTMLPQPRMQLPVSSLPNQVCPSQVDKFSYDIGYQNQEHNRK